MSGNQDEPKDPPARGVTGARSQVDSKDASALGVQPTQHMQPIALWAEGMLLLFPQSFPPGHQSEMRDDVALREPPSYPRVGTCVEGAQTWALTTPVTIG